MGKNLKGKELGKCLYQKKDGRYEAKATINGKLFNCVDKDLSIVKQKLEEAKNTAIEKEYTLNQWFDEWFERYKKPTLKITNVENTHRKYVRMFGDYIGDIDLKELNPDNIQDVLNIHHKNGLAVCTVRSALSLLNQALERGYRNKIIESNPCYGLKVSWESERKDLARYLTQDEQNRFLEEAKNNWYYEMFYFLFNTGLRVGELGGLKWEDIDFDKKRININRSLSCNYLSGVKTIMFTKPKTENSYRSIPMFNDVYNVLLNQKKKQKFLKKQLGDRWRSNGEFSDLVFTTTMGSPIIRYIAEKEINKIVKSLNDRELYESINENRQAIMFEKTCPHAIRHTFCSRCFEKGIDPKIVQMLMGHAHYSTTIDIYTHVHEETFKDEIMKFNSSPNCVGEESVL